MRPVNLIPPDERRDKSSVRTGPIAYLLVGVFALALGAVTMVVLTNNKIADRKAEISNLNAQKAAVETQVTQLKPFITFKQAEQKRVDTIRQLANGRFDWDRVMHELSLILPSDISLTGLTATAGGSSDASGTTSAGPPNMELDGCARSHEAVASFLASLKDIDGVTGVNLQSSDAPTNTAGSSTSVGASGTNCGSTVTFKVTAEFGNAPIPGSSTTPATPATPAAPSTSGSTAAAPVSNTSAVSGTGG